MEGWIKLYRVSLEHWLYTEKRPLTRREAWENMLMLVNREDDKVLIHGTLIDCNRGQSMQSIHTWANIFNWSLQMVRTFFKLLETDKMITIEGMQKTTRLTICNYGKYQDIPTSRQRADNEQITSKQRADNEQITTNKNKKKKKNNKKKENIDIGSFVENQNQLLVKKWHEWTDFRKLLKKPYKTSLGAAAAYNRLLKLADDNSETAIAIITQSMEHEWLGFFPLKTNNKPIFIPGEDIIEKGIKEVHEARAARLRREEAEKQKTKVDEMLTDLEIENMIENGNKE